MTPEQLIAAKLQLNELDTEKAVLRREIDEGIAAARNINAGLQMKHAKLRLADETSHKLRQAVKAHEQQEAARIAAEKAAEKAKADADAAAAAALPKDQPAEAAPA